MSIEQLEIRDYLAKTPPFKHVPMDELNTVSKQVQLRELAAGTSLMRVGDSNTEVFLIRDGAVDVFQDNGELYGRFSDGDWVGYRSVLRGGTVSMHVVTLEDTIFYAVPARIFLDLSRRFESFSKYFSEDKPERLRHALKDMRAADDANMIALHVRDIMKKPLLTSEQDSIQAVARRMNMENAASAMITDAEQNLRGIVTDYDFRKRVVAEGLSVDRPISDIMTTNPLTLTPRDQASEALLLMARRNIRHVPVVENHQVVGVIAATDLLRSQSSTAIYLVGDIFAANTVGQLSELSIGLPQVLVGLVKQNLPAYDIGHAISSIGQAFVRRLISLAEQKFGLAPIPYAFIVAGSMARREQTAQSDQDNGMILSDAYNEAEHGEYFRNVAKFVCDGLDACGYEYCPGNIMATNDQWRQPYSVWLNYFREWIDNPQPQALLYSTIFFDLRYLHGDESLLKNLQTEVLARTKASGLFQAHMASNALTFTPPLGFFRGFVLDKNKDGSDEKGMDMKKRGVVPIIDLARVYALATGVSSVNTWDRLDAVGKAGAIPSSSVEDLRDALEFISMVRLQHQAQQIEKGQKPSNYVAPEELSALERRHLKDAFAVVSSLQDFMGTKYQSSRFR
ncbi:putative nucleotidyltransferase substrate binding domain-containing protein [Thiolinea disciformis]|uniref:putative nucleotidyltransferase substrate binding domain-containing protein n=1 Tax=Thiolinea disciformis TaxID=125614 RepID=UPI00037C4AA4|nr:putative nucleotidyltransferase substrate binding domain-containing protein [Thiolinea disciformis]